MITLIPLMNKFTVLTFATLLLFSTAISGQEDNDQVKLIKMLDADDYQDRQSAYTTLQKLGETARKSMRKALSTELTAESRKSLEQLMSLLRPPMAVYAKIIIPIGLQGKTNGIPVESWIADKINISAEQKLCAFTEWRLLGDKTTRLVEREKCGVPEDAKVIKKDGEIEVQFTIPAPSLIPVKNNVLKNEFGEREIVLVGNGIEGPNAFVALMIGPYPSENKKYESSDAIADDEE